MTSQSASSRHALDSCTFQLQSWKPFQIDPSPKKLCRSDRSTAPTTTGNPSETLDLSRLSLLDDPPPPPPHRDHSFRWFARKRRRRGSRSVSGRSSDRSGTHRRRSSAAYATCSDFPLAAGGTDSSGELFVNGEGSWGSDVSEIRAFSRREMGREVGVMEKECYGGGVELLPGNESGYGSEPGYRGDGEFGYGDEYDEEEEDGRHLFWGGGIENLSFNLSL